MRSSKGDGGTGKSSRRWRIASRSATSSGMGSPCFSAAARRAAFQRATCSAEGGPRSVVRIFRTTASSISSRGSGAGCTGKCCCTNARADERAAATSPGAASPTLAWASDMTSRSPASPVDWRPTTTDLPAATASLARSATYGTLAAVWTSRKKRSCAPQKRWRAVPAAAPRSCVRVMARSRARRRPARARSPFGFVSREGTRRRHRATTPPPRHTRRWPLYRGRRSSARTRSAARRGPATRRRRST